MDLVIRNASLRLAKGRRDIAVDGGKVSAVSSRVRGNADREIDAGGRLVTPGFVNIHCHLDKCLTHAWMVTERGENAGSPDVIPAATGVKKEFTRADTVRRASEAVESSILSGTTAIRAFADVDSTGGLLAVRSLVELKKLYSRAIDIEVVAFPQEGIVREKGTEELLHRALELGADVVGGIPWYERSADDAQRHTDIVFEIARSHGKMIHMLVDDTSDPDARNVLYLIQKTIKEGYNGKVAASHCRGALDSPDDAYAKKIVRLARRAGLTVVENSHVSLFMYGRKDTHPVRRGVTRVKEFLKGGVNVAIGQDDIDDPYYPFGRGDMLELAWTMAHAAHLSTPRELEAAYEMITYNGARGMGLDGYGVAAGTKADLIVLDARSVHDALRTQAPRTHVIKGGRVVGTTEVTKKLAV
jgi:cytosine/creatinine deaminase